MYCVLKNFKTDDKIKFYSSRTAGLLLRNIIMFLWRKLDRGPLTL
jgi:hypothetical protein